MDQGTEPIRQDIEQIRASMTDKMEKIEARIKGTVDETTGSVKRMVDMKYQVSEHPWTALGISILAGIALGSIGDSDSSHSSDSSRSWQGGTDYRGGDMSTAAAYERARSMSAYPSNYGTSGYGQSGYGQGSYGQGNYGQGNYGQGSYGSSSYSPPGYSASGYDRSYGQEHNQSGGASGQSYGSTGYNQGSHGSSSFGPSGSSWSANNTSGGSWNNSQSAKPGVMDQISRQFGGEIETLKSAAVSSLIGLIRDTIRQNFPSMHQEMERMRRDSGAAAGATNWSSNGGSGSSGYGSTSSSTSGSTGYDSTGSGSASNTDYAHSAVNNPSHVTGVSDSSRSSSGFDPNSSPDDLQRGRSTL